MTKPLNNKAWNYAAQDEPNHDGKIFPNTFTILGLIEIFSDSLLSFIIDFA